MKGLNCVKWIINLRERERESESESQS